MPPSWRRCDDGAGVSDFACELGHLRRQRCELAGKVLRTFGLLRMRIAQSLYVGHQLRERGLDLFQLEVRRHTPIVPRSERA